MDLLKSFPNAYAKKISAIPITGKKSNVFFANPVTCMKITRKEVTATRLDSPFACDCHGNVSPSILDTLNGAINIRFCSMEACAIEKDEYM
jgi:hypothetical protein